MDQLVQLKPHQRLACDFILQHPFAGLFLDCGFGKTVTTLEAIYELNPTGHILVIGPKTTMRSTWDAEIAKFGFPFRTKSFIQNDKGKNLSRKARLELYEQVFDELPTIYFVNQELVCDLIDHMPMQGKSRVWPFPYVIIDEVQGFKSPTSKRFKKLREMRPAMTRLIELTGTPTPNGLEDLWSLIYLLDGGERLGRYITHYRETYFFPTAHVNNRPVGWKLRPGMDSVIYDKVSDLVISMRNVGALLPPVSYVDHKLWMDDDEREVYKTMLKESVLEFADGTEAIAANAAVLKAKLLQLASGALYINDSNAEWKEIHSHKLDEAVRIVNNTGSPCIIAYHFKSDLARLIERFEQEGIQAEPFDGSPQMVQRWNAGDIPVMFLQPASAGHGLNLQTGPGHTLIWYTLTWNLEHYIQTNARIYRQGQANPVFIHHILMGKTVDTEVARALSCKDVSMQAFLDAVEMVVADVD